MTPDRIRQLAINERIAKQMVKESISHINRYRNSQSSLIFHWACTSSRCPPADRMEQSRDRLRYFPAFLERS
jgi:hypothetical protein